MIGVSRFAWERLRVLLERLRREQNQIPEIDRVGLCQHILIDLVDAGDFERLAGGFAFVLAHSRAAGGGLSGGAVGRRSGTCSGAATETGTMPGSSRRSTASSPSATSTFGSLAQGNAASGTFMFEIMQKEASACGTTCPQD